MKRWAVLVLVAGFVLAGVTQAFAQVPGSGEYAPPGTAQPPNSDTTNYGNNLASQMRNTTVSVTGQRPAVCVTLADLNGMRNQTVIESRARGMSDADIVAYINRMHDAEARAFALLPTGACLTMDGKPYYRNGQLYARVGVVFPIHTWNGRVKYAQVMGEEGLTSDSAGNMNLTDQSGGSYQSGAQGPIAVGVGWTDFVAASLGLGYAIGTQSTVGTVIGLVGTGIAFIGFGLAVLGALGQGGAVTGPNGGAPCGGDCNGK